MGAMDSIYALILLPLNTLGLFLVLVGLPGTWFMVLSSAAISWLTGNRLLSVSTLAVLAGLALAGEVAELVAGAAGSRKAGGTWRGSAGALAVGLAGGIVGTLLFPVVGSILGACLGAFLGALGGELSGGREMESAVRVGKSAFVGRLLGTVIKLVLGVAIWITATLASFL